MPWMHHWNDGAVIPAPAEAIFAVLDDHMRLAAHMSRSSWMMAGGRMVVSTDTGGGRSVGSHVRMAGTVLGVRITLDEVVTRRDPPREKVWETVGTPRLLVIGVYRMGFSLAEQPGGTVVRIFIDWDLPGAHVWLGRLFGGVYARWCVRAMLAEARRAFARPLGETG